MVKEPPRFNASQKLTESAEEERIPAISSATRWIMSAFRRRVIDEIGTAVYARPNFLGPGPMSTFVFSEEYMGGLA